MVETNPYPKDSALWINWEHRFERLRLPNGDLHVWHCWCGWCDVIKMHVHSAYELVVVDEACDPEVQYPLGETIVL